MDKHPMIQIRNLKKAHGQTRILDSLSLDIEFRETVVIVGPTGSGKTTLLKMIAGLEPPDSGDIFINNAATSRDGKILIPPNKRGLGMIFQDLALWPHMTVKENIQFGLNCQGFTRQQRKTKIDQIKKTINIESFLHRYPAHLSGGEQQKTALARALVLEPDILLMDEPLNSLDPVQKDEILGLIRQIAEKFKMTMVFVTHNRDEVFTLNSRICVMLDGRIVQTGSVKEIMEFPNSGFAQHFFKVP